jgi:homoserine dehydrogenase
MAKEGVQIGLLGLGNVGSGVMQVLSANREAIAAKAYGPLEVKRILVRDPTKARGAAVDPSLLTTDARDILGDPEIDIVCELMGGLEPAHRYVGEALERGKQVVTANKELMARHGHALLAEAARRRQDIYFEGAVAGGIPIIRPLKEDLAANRITRISGILNGTTNYILTRMAADGKEFAAALAEAQALGFAEADPSYDIEGRDAAYKIAILAAIAFHTPVDVERVYHEGITRVSPRDIAHARDLGYVIKLVATASEEEGAIDVRVHPALVPTGHPLASVNDVFNAVLLHGDAVGDVMFFGRGAGSLPTGSAVVGDLIDVARNLRFGATGRVACTCHFNKRLREMAELHTENYMRLLAVDRPGVIAAIAGVLGENQVSIDSVVQKGAQDNLAEIIWVTHPAPEASFRAALARIAELPVVHEICSVIRVVR